MDIPNISKSAFWDIEMSDLDFEKHKEYILKYPGYEVRVIIEHLLNNHLAENQPDLVFIDNQTWIETKEIIIKSVSEYFNKLQSSL